MTTERSTEQTKPMPREHIDLCGPWRFQPDPGEEGERARYFDPQYDHRLWREVHVPSSFEACGPGLEAYEGHAWFRRTVIVPPSWQGKRVVLRFEGVNYHAKVWVNGQEVGEHDDGFLPFELSVRDLIRYDQANLVAVRADNVRRPGDVPGMQRGWRTFGGILREVELAATDPLYLDSVSIVAEPAGDAGNLTIRAEARNGSPQEVEVVFSAQVMDGEGKRGARLTCQPVALGTGEGGSFSLRGQVPGAQPWSPAQPHLYTAVVELAVDGRPGDAQTIRFGFRTIQAQDGRLLLNGEPIYLTGFNRHEDSPYRDMATDLETARRDLIDMKEAGANFVRLCHYPHHPGELDLCDELGLLAMGEIPLYWWDGGPGATSDPEGEEQCASGCSASAKLEAAKRQLRAMIRRDANHPAVIFWSVSNETDERHPEVVDGNRELVRLAQELDPTRLAVHVSNHWRRDPHFEADDVVCVNAYPSLDRRAFQGQYDYDLSESTRFWRENLHTLHDAYPDKPILITEFGYASFEKVYGNAFGEDVQAQAIEAEFAGMDASYVCGATIWCWADHPWPAATFKFCRYLGISPYGVVSRDRRKLRAYWTVQRIYRERQGVQPPPKAAGPRTGPAGDVVRMIRPHLRDIPQVPFPEGYGIRPMRLDEGGVWIDIERDAEEYYPIGDHAFQAEFGYDLQAVRWRCFFVTNAKGVAVGTVSTWYSRDYKGQEYGLIHWIAIRPAYQGRGLGKATMSYALNQLARWHERAMLGTQTKRLRAIKMYLDFGFLPDLDAPGAVESWRRVREQLDHSALGGVG